MTCRCGKQPSAFTSASNEELFIRYKCGPSNNAIHLFIALYTHREIGAAVLPFLQHAEGSTVFLPFKADLLLSAEIRGGQIVSFLRRWEGWRWSERERTEAFEVSELNGEFVFRIPRALTGDAASIDFVIYAKDPNANDGWGWFWGCSDRTVDSGVGDKYISHYHELRLQPVIPSEVEESRGESRVRSNASKIGACCGRKGELAVFVENDHSGCPGCPVGNLQYALCARRSEFSASWIDCLRRRSYRYEQPINGKLLRDRLECSCEESSRAKYPEKSLPARSANRRPGSGARSTIEHRANRLALEAASDYSSAQLNYPLPSK